MFVNTDRLLEELETTVAKRTARVEKAKKRNDESPTIDTMTRLAGEMHDLDTAKWARETVRMVREMYDDETARLSRITYSVWNNLSNARKHENRDPFSADRISFYEDLMDSCVRVLTLSTTSTDPAFKNN
jgi:hypothetical protein